MPAASCCYEQFHKRTDPSLCPDSGPLGGRSGRQCYRRVAREFLAVAIDGPWLKLAEAVDYVHAVGPRMAVPIHEGETTDPAKYAAMLTAFAPEGVVRRLVRGQATTV